MTALSAREDWDTLRRRFAGESLVRIMTACGWEAEAGERAASEPGWADGGIAPYGSILLRTEDGSRQLRVGPVELFWRGTPLDGEPPDWPRTVSPGAVRFFLTSRPLDAPVTLDLDLAARRDENDPYYFTCYIHKRLGTLLSRQQPEASTAPEALAGAGRVLALAVGRFPAAVRRAAETLDPFPVNRYALALAGAARAVLRTGEQNRPLLRAAEMALGNALRLVGIGERDNPQSRLDGNPQSPPCGGAMSRLSARSALNGPHRGPAPPFSRGPYALPNVSQAPLEKGGRCLPALGRLWRPQPKSAFGRPTVANVHRTTEPTGEKREAPGGFDIGEKPYKTGGTYDDH